MTLERAYLTRPEAAQHLQARGFTISRHTLAGYAVHGTGPVFRRWGKRVIYEVAELDRWAAARLSEPHTNAHPRQRKLSTSPSEKAPAE